MPVNRIREPSGDHRGVNATPSNVSCVSLPVSMLRTHKSGPPLLPTRENASVRLSGDKENPKFIGWRNDRRRRRHHSSRPTAAPPGFPSGRSKTPERQTGMQ